MKNDVMSLDDKDYAEQGTGNVHKENKNDRVKKIYRSASQEVKELNMSPKQIKQEDIVVKQELASNSTKATSMYLCPMDDCNFSTTKEGMKTSKAALHLKMTHKIRAVDMKPGMYKFSKIKCQL